MELDLTIEKPAAGGRMVARADGQIVLVAAAIPGERVRARVERVAKGVIYATTSEVIEASPDRRAVTGDWLCGGNVYAHVNYPRQLEIKGAVLADAFARIARLPLPPASVGDANRLRVTGADERGYRMRARLHVRDARLGFFREGTHDLCDPRQTGQLLPATLDVLDRVAETLRRRGIAGVRSVELSENMAADERALHFEMETPEDLGVLGDLAGDVTGLSYSGTFSALPSAVFGTPVVRDSIRFQDAAGEHQLVLQRNVRAFFQGNRYLLPALVARVVSLVEPGPVVDLYAGVGLFGVALAAAGRREITAVEGDRVSAADLKANAMPYGSGIDARQQAVEKFVAAQPASAGTTLVVDPPRTGMSKEALTAITGYRADTIVYVSCDVATLARDVRRLVDAGYRLVHVEAFDLFPNTAHVEAVVKLARRAPTPGPAPGP